ncbi:MAG: pantetheine-phosphate adenylyltransferase [Clostridia bacterium]|nr:pantetheine-phosphate adenylyltransferase [Clostridia bacterium]
MKIAVYPGSFDPITNGHLDIIDRSARLFDKVIVAASVNAGKNPLFTMEERVELIKKVSSQYPNVEVDCFDGLTVGYVASKGAQIIIRGLRAISDFDNEFKMAMTNKKLQPDVETMFMMSKAHYSFLSSSLVKEVACYGGCIKEFVPELVQQALREKYKR